MIAVVVAALPRQNTTCGTTHEAPPQWNPSVLRATNGYNQTETIEALLWSGLQFHNLSRSGRKWGKLATFLTKYRALRHQVERGHDWQLTLEEDVAIRPELLHPWLHSACMAAHKRAAKHHGVHHGVAPDIVQLSAYAEAFLTPLTGAQRLLRLLQRCGILKNDDQQLFDPRVMATSCGETHNLLRHQDSIKGAFRLTRGTNRGDITSSRHITYAEMALLRLLTVAAARKLPAYGNPPGESAFGYTPAEARLVYERRPSQACLMGMAPASPMHSAALDSRGRARGRGEGEGE